MKCLADKESIGEPSVRPAAVPYGVESFADTDADRKTDPEEACGGSMSCSIIQLK